MGLNEGMPNGRLCVNFLNLLSLLGRLTYYPSESFNTERGFGFISQEYGNGKDVFVHISDIEGNMPLEENEYVEFTTQVSDRGLRAINVTRLGSRW